MRDSSDILSDFSSISNSPECTTNQEISLMEEDLRRAHKRLKRAKKKGKSCKKAKKKLKRLKKQHDKLKALLHTTKQHLPRGRWDGLIEKSAPEAFKLVNTIVDRMLPPMKGR